MHESISELINAYKVIQDRFEFSENEVFAKLVTANGNQDYPIQRWFHLKEAFSLDLLELLLNEWDIPLQTINHVLDPFCGSGTTLLSCQKMAKKHNLYDMEVVGVERNPFLHFVAKTKANWFSYDSKIINSKATYLLNGVPRPNQVEIPDLSTLHREDAFDLETIRQALKYRDSIYASAKDNEERDLLLLGYARILEAISSLRKDGRALRIVAGKQKVKVPDALKDSWSMIANDISVANQHFDSIRTHVFWGDGRTLSIEDGSNYNFRDFDIIFYSPPYPNNIDYTEVYKIELWMCGFVNSYEEFRALRHKTFRSHPSVRFRQPISFSDDESLTEVKTILEKITDALPNDKDLEWRTELFNGYFDDMYIALSNQFEALKPGGWIFCVVGNSLHGPRDEPEKRVPIAADIVIALIAESIGLEVKGIQIARHLTRRKPSYGFVRESIVVMRRPG